MKRERFSGERGKKRADPDLLHPCILSWFLSSMLVFSLVFLTGFWVSLLTALALYCPMRYIDVLPAYRRCEALEGLTQSTKGPRLVVPQGRWSEALMLISPSLQSMAPGSALYCPLAPACVEVGLLCPMQSLEPSKLWFADSLSLQIFKALWRATDKSKPIISRPKFTTRVAMPQLEN